VSDVEQLGAPVAIVVVAAVLTIGGYVSSVVGAFVFRCAAGHPLRPWGTALLPMRSARRLARQQSVRTERPDVILWVLAPAGYLGLAAAALTVIPLSPGIVVADVRTGIVLFGSAQAMAIVAIFFHGWSPNSPFALVAGYRFVAVALSYELLSMFVLIGAAIPAESLSIGAIVESQAGLWNVIRQPLGFPLFVIVALGVTFSGPLDLLDSNDLAGGGSVEDSGMQRLAWQAGRHAMRVAFSACAAAVFLGGWQGPILPGGLWMAIKTLAVIALLAYLAVYVARISAERFVRLAWGVLLPLAFLDLLVAGLGAL
ncbi:MAG: NADH-quinone oxidoreductase subunit H, partial [Ilumatobacter sp.]